MPGEKILTVGLVKNRTNKYCSHRGRIQKQQENANLWDAHGRRMWGS